MNDKLGIGKESENKIPVGPLALIALPGCEDFAERVDAYLGMWRHDRDVTHPGYKKDSYIIDVGLPRFGSGEAKGMLKSSVRGDDLFIMADVTNYNIKYKMYGRENPMSPDDHFQNLKRVIAAAGGKARRITVIMPFLYESRQHRRTSRESLDCAMALEELVYMGVNCILTLDAHDPRVQNAIPLSGFENVTATYQLIKALLREEKDLQIDSEHMMVISPDEGAVSRAIYFASMMGLDVGMFYKRRDYTKIVNGRNPIVAHEFLGSSVEGKDVIVVDDMIASGDSAIDVARQLKMRKARKVFLCSTFGLFTSGMERFDEAVK
ncbi:MAG: ribose-phosphate pyrophosphokinase, partial [Lachnospiraceae bacterium]|nr:ribose-phosphate pyrophosphokinase [Lachnospiraceae bacterium]